MKLTKIEFIYSLIYRKCEPFLFQHVCPINQTATCFMRLYSIHNNESHFLSEYLFCFILLKMKKIIVITWPLPSSAGTWNVRTIDFLLLLPPVTIYKSDLSKVLPWRVFSYGFCNHLVLWIAFHILSIHVVFHQYEVERVLINYSNISSGEYIRPPQRDT